VGDGLKSRSGLVNNLFCYGNTLASVKAWANVDRGTPVTAAVEKNEEAGKNC
jgi:hypothetical protein